MVPASSAPLPSAPGVQHNEQSWPPRRGCSDKVFPSQGKTIITRETLTTL